MRHTLIYMKLPISSLFDKKPKSQYFLSLLLRDEKAHAVIIEETLGKIKIIGKHEEHFTTEIESVTDEELLTVLDKTISKAEEPLPSNIETQKTVFGVKGDWVEEKKIKKDYLIRLKKVCDTLHLTPIGFLVISEAIAHLIQEEEGAPLSALLCEVGGKQLTLTLFRAGKIIETKMAHIDDTVPNTVDTLLKHIESVEVLPSRIIVYNGKQSDDLAQQFISHQWSKSLPFLHMPQISVLPHGFEAKAVVFGAALQLGFEITGAIVDKTGQEIKTFSSENGKTEAPELAPEQPDQPVIQSPETAVTTEESNIQPVTDPTPAPTEGVQLSEMQGDNFGFVMNQDIANTATTAPVAPVQTAAQTSPSPATLEQDNQPVQPVQEERTKTSILSSLSFSKLTPLLAKVKEMTNQLPNPLRFTGGRNKRLIAIPIVLLVILGILVFSYLSLLSADVTLHIKTKGLEETQPIIFSLTSPNDFSQNIVAVQEVSTSLETSASTSVTGKKQVGEKSKGTVTIYNSDNAKKTLPQGTTITSSNNVAFILDKEVSVASASGDIFSGTKPGTAQVAVTAKEIGPEGNLPSNTKFTVSGSNSLAGKNDSAFSGGSKKDVTIVAAADVEKLRNTVEKNVEEKAKEELAKKVGDDTVLLPSITSVDMEKESLSKKVGEEAKELTLKATITFSSASYKKTDLSDFASVFLKNKFSEDLTISEKGIQTSVENVKVNEDDEDKLNAVVKVKAGLLPKVETASLTKKITGKSFTEATSELEKIPQYESVDIELKPALPFLPKVLPQKTKNIRISIATNE